MGRRAQRAADVGTEFQRHKPGRERRRAAARRAAGGARKIPRIVGRAIDLVKALPVGQMDRHIGLADVHLKAQIIRELDRLELVLAQLKTVAAERDALLKPASDETPSPPAMLVQLKGIGPESAAVLWSEGLFRRFDNRRQVAAYAGLAPTPWQSGSIDHEQGVSKAGNSRLRTAMVELAWLWLRNQPSSALSLWFHERIQRLGGRMRKTIIVALARKLLIALWRYTTAGVVIEGAVMKPAPATI